MRGLLIQRALIVIRNEIRIAIALGGFFYKDLFPRSLITCWGCLGSQDDCISELVLLCSVHPDA